MTATTTDGRWTLTGTLTVREVAVLVSLARSWTTAEPRARQMAAVCTAVGANSFHRTRPGRRAAMRVAWAQRLHSSEVNNS